VKGFLICDLQFGSTGKGSISYFLARRHQIEVAVAANMPNAGHTAVDEYGNKFVHTVLPAAAAAPSVKVILLGPGSVIDAEKLVAEMRGLPSDKICVIHPSAIFLSKEDLDAEQGLVGIGSTMKGSMAANIRRMARKPHTLVGERIDLQDYLESRLGTGRLQFDADLYNRLLDRSPKVIVEGSQGFSLSIFHGMYPWTTSRDTTPNAIAADCALPADWWDRLMVVGSMRTLPIRVANRYDADGKLIGTSGPWYPDQRELSWEEVGVEPELTTVTRLPRRIASYSRIQIEQAIRMCRPRAVFLNFCNYVTEHDIDAITRHVEECGSAVYWRGYGPALNDIRPMVGLADGQLELKFGEPDVSK